MISYFPMSVLCFVFLVHVQHHHPFLCLPYFSNGIISLLKNFHLCSRCSGEVKFTLVNSNIWKRRNVGVENGHLLYVCMTLMKFKFRKVQAM